jgi:hypothetical protein
MTENVFHGQPPEEVRRWLMEYRAFAVGSPKNAIMGMGEAVRLIDACIFTLDVVIELRAEVLGRRDRPA